MVITYSLDGDRHTVVYKGYSRSSASRGYMLSYLSGVMDCMGIKYGQNVTIEEAIQLINRGAV
jgi:3-deoxy-D-arabino-heptulosonate 7-phosphate (DAHP) synthase class II